MTYMFIDCSISKSTTAPDFEIPQLRFVNAGLTIGYATTFGGGGSWSVNCKAGLVSMAYLVEELIPDAKSCVKFIHNGTCRPLPHLDDPAYEIAEFLAFTQHIQYIKTGGMAYISDYQGKFLPVCDCTALTYLVCHRLSFAFN